MKALVTGSNGFIGTHLLNELDKRGWEFSGFDLSLGQDVTDKEQVMEAVKDKDIVFHLAGMLGTHELVDCAAKAVQVNVIGTLNVLEACKKYGVKLVEISKPNCWVNTYTITKVAAESFTEMYRREFGVEAVTVKWFNVYGPGQKLVDEVGYKKFIPTAITNAWKNEPIEIYGDGLQTMDLIHTTDTIEATLSLVDNWKKVEGGVFEIGSGEEVSVNEIAKKIREMTLSDSEIKHINMRKGETEHTSIKANVLPIYLATGWKPRISLHEGLMDTINFYKNYETNKK